LAVHPSWQRKGIGKMLMRDGIARARRENVPARLESSPSGAGMYKNVGFRQVGSMTELRGVTGPIFIWDPAVDDGEKDGLTKQFGNGSM
jgi:GNAT superfamily N-acetyltransferase